MPIAVFRVSAHRILRVTADASTPDDMTRQLPRGLYTTFSTNSGGTRVLGLTAHLDRLYLPAAKLSPTPSASRTDLRLALAKLALDSAPGESRFRLLLSLADGMVYIIIQPFTPLAKEIYERGVRVVTAELSRHDPRLKDSGFIAESQSQRGRVGGEIFEVLLTRKGKIYEGMTSNFYAVLSPVTARNEAVSSSSRGLLRREVHPPRNDGILVTARTGILLGVTRRAVLHLARGQGMGIVYRAPRVASRESFAEAFLTSSSRGVVPIVSIDGRWVGEGRPGAWTKLLVNAYQTYVEERSEEIAKEKTQVS